MADYSFIGAGKVCMRKVGSAAPLREVGNVSALNFAVAEDTRELRDFTKGGGGIYNSVTRVSSVDLAMTMHDLSGENAAIVLFGEANAITAAAVSDELVTAYQNGLSPTAFPINTELSVTVTPAQADAAARVNTTAYSLGQYYTPAVANGFFYKCTTAGTSAASPPTFGTTIGGTTVDGTATFTCAGKTTLVADTDYTVSGAGISFTATGLIDGEVCEIDYTKAAGWIVEALLNSAQDYELVFDGLNEARSGKPVVVHVYKYKPAPTAGLPLIGEDYLAMEVTGKVQKDSSKNGTSVSQYFRVTIVE